MTTLQIYNYAYAEALRIWAKENELLQQLPENEFTQARERMAWENAMEIRETLMELEKEGTEK